MKHVYIILSRSSTIFALIIRAFTKKYYNHTSFALDKSLDTFYSFGRRNPRLMFPAGFITEGLHTGFFGLHPDTKICVLELEVTREQYRLIQERLKPFIENPKKYKYDVFHRFFNMPFNRPYKNKNNYVCSVFAANLLRDIYDMGKDCSLVYPEDFYRLKYNKIYEGTARDYNYEQ